MYQAPSTGRLSCGQRVRAPRTPNYLPVRKGPKALKARHRIDHHCHVGQRRRTLLHRSRSGRMLCAKGKRSGTAAASAPPRTVGVSPPSGQSRAQCGE